MATPEYQRSTKAHFLADLDEKNYDIFGNDMFLHLCGARFIN